MLAQRGGVKVEQYQGECITHIDVAAITAHTIKPHSSHDAAFGQFIAH